jgi:acyl-[acyl-carrier-protein]-phospholipid O-acyltransferase/long-chain-fatty-acid--[acyl-carrier-protein] ligase
MAVVAGELWFATQAVPAPPEGALYDRAAFFSQAWGWRIFVDFALLAAFAGAYVTPLNAVLQRLSPPARRARTIACSNVVDAALIVASAGAVALCVALGLEAADILALFALSGAAMAVAVARHAPDTRLGRIALAAFPRSPAD